MNDFVILPDAQAQLALSPTRVAHICDRRSGLGADGILRVIPVTAADHVPADSEARWFMDYRNADGSIAEMCGNGARVFARFLVNEGWETDSEFTIETRAGTHRVEVLNDERISVEMGKPAEGPPGPPPVVRLGDLELPADAWWLPNPHAVVFVNDLSALAHPLPAPQVEDHSRFPTGQNVEFVEDLTATGSLEAIMRVHERGVGETLSCGTGACAVSLSLRQRHGVDGAGVSIVDVPGGRLEVRHAADGRIDLVGPADLVGRGNFDAEWWENAG